MTVTVRALCSAVNCPLPAPSSVLYLC